MNTLLHCSKFLVIALALMLTSFVTVTAQTVTITTDKQDYPPGSTVIITGSGFAPNDSVTLRVTHEGETGDDTTSSAHAPWTVIADANGNVNSTWLVPADQDELNATLKLTADGQTPGFHAEHLFTDAVIDDGGGGGGGGGGGTTTYTFYLDADGDNYGDNSHPTTNTTGTAPTGYVTNNTDCNDGDASKHTSYWFYADNDRDGYGAGSLVSVCAVNAGTAPVGYTLNNTDCNDNNAAVHPGAAEVLDGIDNDCDGQIDEGLATYTFYLDADSDGYGDINSPGTSSINTAPSGFVSNNTDCDDSDPTRHTSYAFYADPDGDGFGAGSLMTVCAENATTAPPGYSLNNTDCAPADGNKWQSLLLYIDADADGYDAGTTTVCYGATVPFGYKTTTLGTDCNDADASKWRSATVFTDADGDGYTIGSTLNVCYGTALPAGVTTTNLGTDCDDANVTKWRSASVYTDADGDGYTVGSTLNVCYGTALPAGVTTTSLGTDCDDNNKDVWHSGTLYIDADGDGYTVGTGEAKCYGSSIPSGYQATRSSIDDCNDADAGKHASFSFYADADGDGYGAGSLVSECALDANTAPAGYSLNNTDCAPNDNTKWRSATLYVDADADGYDNGTATVCYGSTVPAGYKSTTLGPDCNDADATKWRSATVYTDADGDGYTVGNTFNVCYGTALPAGVTTTSLGSDCNDADATKHASFSFYADGDGDGYGAGSLVSECALDANTAPAGYSLNNTDCAPNDNTRWHSATLYTDADNDHYTVGNGVTVCYGLSIPPGYQATKSLTDDCNDADGNKWRSATVYTDADGDGYTTGSSFAVCYGTLLPAGVTTTSLGTDCDDTQVSINPGINPTVQAPAAVNANTSDDGLGNCTTTVNLGTPTTNNNCSIHTIQAFVGSTVINPLTYTFSKGTTVVTWKVTDGQGRTATDNQSVIVTDNEKPGKPTLADVTGECTATATVPTATDNCSGTITGTTTDALSYNTQGTHAITWSFNDGNGNVQTALQNVVVKDVTAPVPDATSLGTATGECSVIVSTVPAATDNCKGKITGTTSDPLTYTLQGDYTIHWTYDDGNGNKSYQNQPVSVHDVTVPVAICKAFTIPLGLGGTVTISASDVNNNSYDNCSAVALSIDKSTFNSTNIGSNNVVLTVKDASGNSSQCTAVVTIQKRPTIITYTGDLSEQYSDQQSLTAVLKDQLTNTVLSNKTVGFVIGSQSTSAVTTASGIATASLILTQDPTSDYSVATSFSGDATYLSSSSSTAFDITQEDALVDYTGNQFASTTCATCTAAPVKLSATIQDMNDGLRGDIALAKVVFKVKLQDNSIVTVPATTLNYLTVGDKTVAVASADYMYNLPKTSNGFESEVTVQVGKGTPAGYYITQADVGPVTIEVARLQDYFVAGGGHINPTLSTGVYKSDANSRTHFAFNVKYSKTGNNLQGSLNVIFTSGNIKYQVKGVVGGTNGILSVNVTDNANRKAVLTCKASMINMATGLQISGTSNSTVTMKMTDKGEPGKYDTYAIELIGPAGNLLYSSNWVKPVGVNNYTTAELVISTGNIVVNGINTTSTTSTLTAAIAPVTANSITNNPLSMLKLDAYPNPTISNFNLVMNSTNKVDKITLLITDVLGRVKEIRHNVNAGEVVHVGDLYPAGIYFALIKQGSNYRQVKLIKGVVK